MVEPLHPIYEAARHFHELVLHVSTLLYALEYVKGGMSLNYGMGFDEVNTFFTRVPWFR
jgi:hypothetical protein